MTKRLGRYVIGRDLLDPEENHLQYLSDQEGFVLTFSEPGHCRLYLCQERIHVPEGAAVYIVDLEKLQVCRLDGETWEPFRWQIPNILPEEYVIGQDGLEIPVCVLEVLEQVRREFSLQMTDKDFVIARANQIQPEVGHFLEAHSEVYLVILSEFGIYLQNKRDQAARDEA